MAGYTIFPFNSRYIDVSIFRLPMFKTSSTNLQPSMFSSAEMVMNRRQISVYSNPASWFNKFYELVVCLIDETVFEPLYSADMGTPNVPIRVLVGMHSIKEGMGWSDRQLEEALLFNLAIRRALGFVNIDDMVPAMSSYYLWRKKTAEYDIVNGVNLMSQSFHQVAAEQIKLLQISGSAVRMDSKLIGSNIASYTRYEIVWCALNKAEQEGQFKTLKPKLRKRLDEVLAVEAKKTIYDSNTASVQKKLQELGRLVYDILVSLKIQDGILHRVFHEQFRAEKGQVEARPKEEISATSIQNPNDVDATYRQKDEQRVKGYSKNITETVPEDGKPSIITDVQVENASTADNTYTKDALETTELVTGRQITTLYADGAYQSQEVAEYLSRKGIASYFTGLQGKAPRYILNLESMELWVTDVKTGERILAEERGEGVWRITLTDAEGKRSYRYFRKADVERSYLRQLQSRIPQEEFNKRNNVEAGMFQLSFHTRNNKTRYRGLEKHRFLACARATWMNFIRIANYQAA